MTHAETIRGSLPCSIELPAGTGKTELIGSLVKLFADEGKRCLVLTHTHAGVDVLRRRMKKFGVPRGAVTIRTLDAWCFDLIGSFPDLSGIGVGDEPDWSLSTEYQAAGARAVISSPVVRMLEASYDLLVVDEYQDCQLGQHELVKAIAASVPTCVLGDRMQGLFYFGNQQPVLWESDVAPVFPPVELSAHPWRWAHTNPELGDWLLQARLDLLDGKRLNLSGSPVNVADPSTVTQVLFGMPGSPDTVAAISQFPKSAALLARRTGGGYTMIEELEGKHLRTFAEVIDEAEPAAIAGATAQYAIDCAFGVAETVSPDARRRLLAGKTIAVPMGHPEAAGVIALLNGLLSSADVGSIRRAMVAISRLPGFGLYRREAWYGILDALRLCETTSGLTALDAVVSIRNMLRVTGRRPESRIIGRALLVKGLEFDHSVLDVPSEYRPYNAHELYVGLTRGSSSVTLMSTSMSVGAKRPQRQG